MQVLDHQVSHKYATAVVKSDSGKTYNLVVDFFVAKECDCSCPDYFYRQRFCKHLRFYLDHLRLVFPKVWEDAVRRLIEEDKIDQKEGR